MIPPKLKFFSSSCMLLLLSKSFHLYLTFRWKSGQSAYISRWAVTDEPLWEPNRHTLITSQLMVGDQLVRLKSLLFNNLIEVEAMFRGEKKRPLSLLFVQIRSLLTLWSCNKASGMICHSAILEVWRKKRKSREHVVCFLNSMGAYFHWRWYVHERFFEIFGG